MIKKYGLWYTIKYYRFIPLLIMAFILYILHEPLFQYLCYLTMVDEHSKLYKLFHMFANMFLIYTWIICAFTTWRSRQYLYMTGRNFENDTSKYKRSYWQLVDYFKDAEPHKLDTSMFPVSNWRDVNGIIFGIDEKRLLAIPSNSECNLAIFGPPGSGKTSGIGIINAMQFSGSVLAVDIKGDIYNYVKKHSKRTIVRFCPDDPNAMRESFHFDPLAGIWDMDVTDRKLYIDSMATVLIPDDGGSDGNYFSSRARKMFQGIVHLLLHKNPDISFPDIIHSILSGNIFDWVNAAIEGDCLTAKELLASFYGNNEKNITSAYDCLTTALVNFSSPVLDKLLSKSNRSISIDTLELGTDVYLQISQEHLDVYAPLFTLIIQSFSTAFTKRPDSSTGAKNRPILMLLDEFPQLTFSYGLINRNLSTLRSKNVICMIIQQNLSQLEQRYKNTGARSIIGNCNYQIILGSNDITTSKTFSDFFGTKKVLKVSNSHTVSKNDSSGLSVHETTEKVFPPEHFGDLPSQNSMIIYFKGKYTECKKLNCYKN